MSYNNYNNNRGRGFSRGRGFERGQSPSRPYQPNRGRGRRNFFDDDVANQEAKKIERKEEQIKEKKEEIKPKVDEEKKENLINKGKQWFNKFFAGIKKQDRANVKVDYNTNFELQLYESYLPRLHSISSTSYYYTGKDVMLAPSFFRSYINILIGIKMIKSIPDGDRGLVKLFQPLLLSDLDIPKNMNIIIDGIGKTDGIGDNVIRLIGQTSLIKNHFIKAIMLACTYDERYYFDNMLFREGFAYDDAVNFRNNHLMKNSNLKFFSSDRSGVELINEYGKRSIEKLNVTNFKVKVLQQTTVEIRLPYLDPKSCNDIGAILEWEKNVSAFFTAIKFDPGQYNKVIGLALLGWLPLRFIDGRKKTFAELDKRFDGTIFSKLTPEQILVNDDWYCTNDLLSDDQIFDNIIYLIQMYNSKFKKIYGDIFNMVKFIPSAYGNSSQMIQGHRTKDVFIEDDEFQEKVAVVKNDRPTVSFIKMNEEECILGSVFKMNNYVRFKSGYEINLVGSSKEIRSAFINYDFK